MNVFLIPPTSACSHADCIPFCCQASPKPAAKAAAMPEEAPLSEGHGDLQILIYNCWIGLRGKPTGNYVFFDTIKYCIMGKIHVTFPLNQSKDMTCN